MKTEQELKNVFGNNVKTLRIRRALSQEKLAEKAGVSKNTISDIESGDKFARAYTIVSLARSLQTEVYELFKTDAVLPDKPVDIIAKYSEEVMEKIEEIGSSFIEKMKK